jgi:lysozyme
VRGITPELLAFVKEREKFSATPYLCPAGYPTIGYGHVIKSLDHPAITHEFGEDLLRADLALARNGALKVSPSLHQASERRQAAIIDFCFNCGVGNYRASTLRRKVDAQEWDAAAVQMRRWVYGGGRKLRGLVIRRAVTANWLVEG